MDFIYNHEIITTQDELKISVADLRDLIKAGELLSVDNKQAVAEYQLIVNSILHKNKLGYGVILVGN